MNARLIHAIAEAMKEHDVEIHNDVEPFDYYTEKASIAIDTYEAFEFKPRPRVFFVEGVQSA